MKSATCAMLLLVCLAFAFAQKPERASSLQSMVDTERAFARMSEEQGIRPSFLAFIADDGILFRPRAVKGKEWMLAHPLPPSEKKPLLKWAPSFADVAFAGDMGYTFGPWEYKDDVKDARPSAFGHFVTVWKKQADDSWKFAVDLGVSHPQTNEVLLPDQVAGNFGGFGPAPLKDLEPARRKLLALERAFSQLSAEKGARAAFMSYAAPNVRLFRENKLPVKGHASASESIPTGAGVWTWQPQAWDVSSSDDLGYSYGIYELKNGQQTETGNYFRIWKRQKGVWKVVMDLANPVPAT